MSQFKFSDVYNLEILPHPTDYHALDLLFRIIRCLTSKVYKSSFMTKPFRCILEYSCKVYRTLFDWMKHLEDDKSKPDYKEFKDTITLVETLENILLRLTNQVKRIPTDNIVGSVYKQGTVFHISIVVAKVSVLETIKDAVVETVNAIAISRELRALVDFEFDTSTIDLGYGEFGVDYETPPLDPGMMPPNKKAQDITKMWRKYSDVTQEIVQKRTSLKKIYNKLLEDVLHPLLLLMEMPLSVKVPADHRKSLAESTLLDKIDEFLDKIPEKLRGDFTQGVIDEILKQFDDVLKIAIPPPDKAERIPNIDPLYKLVPRVQRPFHLQALVFVDSLQGLVEEYKYKEQIKKRLALELAIKTIAEVIHNASAGIDEGTIESRHREISGDIFSVANDTLYNCFRAFDGWFKSYFSDRKSKHKTFLLQARNKDNTALVEYLKKENCWRPPIDIDMGYKAKDKMEENQAPSVPTVPEAGNPPEEL